MITRPEESYRLWRVVVRDLETSKEEAKARYRVVNTNPQWAVTSREKKLAVAAAFLRRRSKVLIKI